MQKARKQKTNTIDKVNEGPSTSGKTAGNARSNSKRTQNQDDVHDEPILQDISCESIEFVSQDQNAPNRGSKGKSKTINDNNPAKVRLFKFVL